MISFKEKRGLELAISTLILIILGLLVLIGVTYMLTGGFKKFNSSTDPFLSTAEASSVRQACDIACTTNDRLTYCCKNFTIQGAPISCFDIRLEVACSVSCSSYSCNSP